MNEVNLDIHKDIIAKAQKGKSKAQKQLYELYSKAMFNICYRMMNNIEEAEDMLQEAFCYAFSKLDTFRFESTFGAWLKRIVINRCINEIKRKKIELQFNDNIHHLDVEDQIEYDNTQEINFSVEKIKKAMGLLPDGYRLVFSLYLIEGYDHVEIAEILNITESTSKSQLNRAKKKLIEIINAGTLNYCNN